MRPFEDIDDFFEPGATLREELDDEALLSDLEHQKDVLLAMRIQREERAYDDAESEARELGLPEPTEAMVQRSVRWYENIEKDQAPNQG